jgi:hypothetical protein
LGGGRVDVEGRDFRTRKVEGEDAKVVRAVR